MNPEDVDRLLAVLRDISHHLDRLATVREEAEQRNVALVEGLMGGPKPRSLKAVQE